MTQTAVKLIHQLWRSEPSGGLIRASDMELLKQFAGSSDESAFAEIVRRHGPMVWGVCHRILRHRQDAEDAFQATFIVLARKAALVGRRGLLVNWLFGVARRASLCLRRCRIRRQEREKHAESTVQLGGSALPAHDLEMILDEELARLPRKYRLPILLCAMEGLTHVQAGQQLSWPTGTVAGRLSRARQILRSRLRRRGVEVGGVALGVSQPASAALQVQYLIPKVLVSLAGTSHGKLQAAAASGTIGYLVNHLTGTTVWQGWMTIAMLMLVSSLPLLGIPLRHPESNVSHRNPVPVAIEPAEMIDAVFSPERLVSVPDEPDAAVLTWEQFQQDTGEATARLRMRADGFVEFTASPSSRQFTSSWRRQINQRELQELLQYLVHEADFFSLESEQLKRSIQRDFAYDGSIRNPADLLVTRLFLRAAGRSHTIEWRQLSSAHVYFGQVPELRRLLSAETRLRNFVAISQAGGKEAAERIAGMAHEQLTQTYPKLPPFSTDELWSVRWNPQNSTTQYVFSRGDKYHGPDFFSATLSVARQGKPEIVSVIPGPSASPPQYPHWPEPRCLEDDWNP